MALAGRDHPASLRAADQVSRCHGNHAAQLRVGMNVATYATAAMTADAGSLLSSLTD
jgi:hypothetical protein